MTRRGLLLFAAMCLIWGIPYLFIRIAVGELTPATLVFLRTGVAAVVLLPIAIRRGGLRRLIDKSRPLIIFAMIEIGIPWLALSTAEQHITSSLAGLLISAVPLVGVVIASVGVLSLVCTALAFLIFFALIAEIGPVRATVITYINPAVAAVAGILVLHERFTAGMGIGFVLVLIGSTLATRRARAGQARPSTVTVPEAR